MTEQVVKAIILATLTFIHTGFIVLFCMFIGALGAMILCVPLQLLRWVTRGIQKGKATSEAHK